MEHSDPCLHASGMAVVIFGIIKALFYMVLFFVAYIHEINDDWYHITLFTLEESVCIIFIICNIYLMLGIVRVSFTKIICQKKVVNCLMVQF